MSLNSSKARLLFLLFFSAFLFRIILSFWGIHPDILSQVNWGRRIFENGLLNFYDFSHWIYEWPSQPPLVNFLYSFSFVFNDFFMGVLSGIGVFIAGNHLGAGHLLFYFNFVKYFGSATFPTTDILMSSIIITKWWAILADVFIGLIFFKILRSKLSFFRSFVLTTVYFILPFGWYVSSFWGQYDQIGFLFLLSALLLLYRRYFLLSTLAFFVAFQMKPTVILFSPFFIAYFFRQKPNWKNFLISLGGVLILDLIITLPFINSSQILYQTISIYKKVFLLRREATLLNHAFNFWAIIFPQGKIIKNTDLIYFLGNLLILLANLAAIIIIKKDQSFKMLLVASYVLTAGVYLFGIGMLDRYFFSAVVFLGLNLAYYPKLLKYWLLTALLFSFNLFYSWGFPVWIYGRGWNNDWVIRICSLAQVILFFLVLKKIWPKFKYSLFLTK